MMGDVIKMHRLGRTRPGEVELGYGPGRSSCAGRTSSAETSGRKGECDSRPTPQRARLAPGDAEIIAGNLSRILDQAKARGINKQMVCGEVSCRKGRTL